ncbi:hypothetical protein BDV12DRAFT_183653 [Aspergillus spectabilis]
MYGLGNQAVIFAIPYIHWELWKDFYFAERFPSHEEIRGYFDHVEKILELKKDIQFNARVNSATWDESKVARYLCVFTGMLHRQYLPREEVAVIGAGATGVQTITRAEQDSWKPYFKLLFDASRKSASGLPILPPTKEIFELSDAERDEVLRDFMEVWVIPLWMRQFPQIYTDPRVNRLAYDFWAKKTRARFTDPVKRDLMAPPEPPFHILTRRSPLENDFYDCLDRENVEIVPLLQTPVATMIVKSKHGIDIKDNYSPQAPTALSNNPTILECQVDFIVDFIIDAIAKMEKEDLETIEPTAEAEEEWRQMIIETGSQTVFTETELWWTASNITGRKKELLTATLNGWKGFHVKMRNPSVP